MRDFEEALAQLAGRLQGRTRQEMERLIRQELQTSLDPDSESDPDHSPPAVEEDEEEEDEGVEDEIAQARQEGRLITARQFPILQQLENDEGAVDEDDVDWEPMGNEDEEDEVEEEYEEEYDDEVEDNWDPLSMPDVFWRREQMRQLEHQGEDGANDANDEEDDEGGLYAVFGSRASQTLGMNQPIISNRLRRALKKTDLEEIPSPVIQKLMKRGEFGHQFPSRGKKRDVFHPETIDDWMLRAKLGYEVPVQELTKKYLPINLGRAAKFFVAPAYGGQFSDDGTLFYCYSQEFRVHVMDTKDPARPRTIRFYDQHHTTDNHLTASWTITDAHMSSDNQYLAWSSLSAGIYFERMDLDDLDARHSSVLDMSSPENGRFGIISTRISRDNKTIIAGTTARTIAIYDLTRQVSTTLPEKHRRDVNSVRFLNGDTRMIASGSDDHTIRIWDLRASRHNSVGCFLGHMEGISAIDVKSDSRYLISNGKDQCMKLWDMRKMMPQSKADGLQLSSASSFDYRHNFYRGPSVPRHPHDSSIMTYRGHEVLRTAIRCHFSPSANTGEQYLYSGSSDGRVCIWKLDGTLIRQLNGSTAMANTMKLQRNYPEVSDDPVRQFLSDYDRRNRIAVPTIRDCSWHPYQPYMYAPCWTSSPYYDGGILPDFLGGGLLVFPHEHETVHDDLSGLQYHLSREYNYSSTHVDEPEETLNSLYRRPRAENLQNDG